jgi:hypothetical protein
MAAERDPSPVADLVFTAISPALIMLMVGSLIYFLITVLPTGDYKERLQYTTFFFVFGAVLVARIAIQLDGARASMYGLGLAVATFLAMTAFVEYPAAMKSFGWLINLGLMALIWWSAHKLTWDCTWLDENKDASGRGLLAASFTDEASREPSASAAPPEPDAKPKKRKRKKTESAFSTWTARWWAYRESRKNQPHTPGVWVIYFALAALPLFAIGQSLIPADDDSRRTSTFLQMAVYVGSALGLLVTTSLLGLRRYLRQRKAKMPAALTAGWLGLGAVLIAGFLMIGAFLPRPYSEVPWFGLPQAGKSDREASKYAQLRDSAGKGDGAEGEVTEKGDGKAVSKNGDKKSAGGKGGNAKGGGKDGDSKGESDSKDDGKSSEKSDSEKSGESAKEAREARDRTDRGNSSGRSSGSNPSGTVTKIAQFVKWIVLAIVIVVVVCLILLAVLRYLAPFTEWARNLLDAILNWWANLFGSKKTTPKVSPMPAAPAGPQRPPPFSDYSNPFSDGSAANRRPEELVGYTFEALDAWAWDHGAGRDPAETPFEFTARLGTQFPELDASVKRLANLYARIAYAIGPLPRDTKQFLETLWDELTHGAPVGAP